MSPRQDPESRRLAAADHADHPWLRWGPYLSERQWGTVREDYSADGDPWTYLPFEQAHRRAYRWGEDGLLGLTDRDCRLCFAPALWNGRDPILKERLFGLGNPQGNHGEDVKELHYYLDAVPTASYLRALYRYPQAEFPYARLVEENARRGLEDPEFELEDTGVLDDGRVWDVGVEYAKASPDDVLIRLTLDNRGPDAAALHVLPQLWLRNTWSWGREGDGFWPRGAITRAEDGGLLADHPSLGRYRLACAAHDGAAPDLLFTDNETDARDLFSSADATPYVKDAFHHRVIDDDAGAVNPAEQGTKAAAWYRVSVPGGGRAVLTLRLTAADQAAADPFADFDDVFAARMAEADAYHAARRPAPLTDQERLVVRQADAGLIWSQQFYHLVVRDWLDGDPGQPAPPPERRQGPMRGWEHLHARDVILMPDPWEYPWFAAWDLAFQCVALARLDPANAKRQLLLLGDERYMHPSGALPAYEFAFGDANPPLHAWAAWRVYQLSADDGEADRDFLQRAFHKSLLNFTWWVNREDSDGNNLFSGGFLGLDNIGVFDRSKPLPGGGHVEQADATAWMAFFSSTMLAMAVELARGDAAYQDIAAKFLAHFLGIARAMNSLGGTGLWDDADGFYYDKMWQGDHATPLRVRSLVGLIPLFAAEAIAPTDLEALPALRDRLRWFREHEPELAASVACLDADACGEHLLLSIPTRERLERILARVLDPAEFLSPHGVRSLSRAYADAPFVLELDGERHEIRYAPGESEWAMFGGNSNWRGPVWVPLNYLLIEALKRHHHFYGDGLTVECPAGSGERRTLLQVAEELERRIGSLFLPDADGRRPALASSPIHARDPHARGLLLFHEYFHGDDGRGLGASHQTGWTALAANILERVAMVRDRD
ncbi:MAG TPA: glucosidase [Candidatus Krumholzibacteria bacterium]|nr:glucosidase [Candidatus Krumholzibacteria bacterium]